MLFRSDLREALEKLQLNDASLVYEPETSGALGFGFRCGFLGLLHMEIVRERLEREFDLDLLTTAPNVAYNVLLRNGQRIEVHNPSEMPRELENVEELGVMTPAMRVERELRAGEVGYIITGLKEVSKLRVGDTLTLQQGGAEEALPGYKDVKPMVFAGLFPTDGDDYPQLDRKSTRLNSSHIQKSRMPSSA